MKIKPKWSAETSAALRAIPAEKVLEHVSGKTARDVVETARPERSILHKCFEWDNRVAGEAWRLGQARQMMRCIVFDYVPTKNAEPLEMRCLINSGEEAEGQKPCLPIAKVLKDDDLREEYVRDLTGRLVAIKGTLDAVRSLSRSFVDASEKVGQAILALKGAEA